MRPATEATRLFSAEALLAPAELEALEALLVPLWPHAARTTDRAHVCLGVGEVFPVVSVKNEEVV